mmetsp:Transcript_9676/g.30643  ORF Transcript_9676/g.30643 Transcript_9676/m.30643 type:complete len:229 (-) Transcript_9676:1614-2300(-)
MARRRQVRARRVVAAALDPRGRAQGDGVVQRAAGRRRPLGGRLRRAALPDARSRCCVVRDRPPRRDALARLPAGDGALPARAPAAGRRLGHAHRIALDHVRLVHVLHCAASPRRAARRSGDGQGPRLHPLVRWWHLHGLVGQAVHVPPRRDGLGGAPSDPARAVAATRLVPLPPGAALVPLPDGLPAHVLPLRQALRLPRRRDRPAHRLAPLGALLPGLRRRAVGEHA